MHYYVKMKLIKNNLGIGPSIIVYNYESKNTEDLVNEIVEFYTNKIKESFTDFDYILIERLDFSYKGLELENKEIPEEYKELYETSKNEEKELLESKEYKINVLKRNMNKAIEVLESIRKEAEELEILDTQEFLDYQDKLNKFSLDPDRK